MKTSISRTMTALMLVAAFVAVGNMAVAKKGGMHYSLDLLPRFNVPKAETPPEIDGKINKQEWKDAITLRGVTSASSLEYFGRPTIFYVAWDNKHLYLGARSSIRPGEKLVKSKRQEFTKGVVYDDAYEIGIDLLERNKRADEAPFFFKFIVNALKAGEYQKIYPSIGQSLFTWYPEFDLENKRWKDDSGQRWWDMEVAMDLEDLEMPQEHEPGDLVKLLLARDYKRGWEQVAIPTANNFLVSEGFPRATLTAEKPYVKIETLEGLHDQKVTLGARVINPGKEPAEIRGHVKIRNAKGSNTPGENVFWKEEKTFTLAPGASKMMKVNRDVPEPSAFLDIKFTEVEDGKKHNVYEYHTHFKESDKGFLEYNREPPAFPFTARFNPIKGKLWMAADTLDAQVDDKDRIKAFKWRVEHEGEVLKEGRITQQVYQKFQDLVNIDNMEPGEYTVTGKFVDGNGEELLTRSASFTKKNEAEAFSAWWNNDIGDTDQVLRPFEPLEVAKENDATHISPVLRTYALDGLGLPQHIESSGHDVLSKPARIIIVSEGKTYEVPTDGTVTVTKEKPWRVHFKGSSSVAGISFDVEGVVGQDGLVDLDLTYAPTDDPVQIEEFRIEWPVDDTQNNYMTVIGPGGNYATREIGSIPQGEGVVWDSLHDLGKRASNMTKGNFYSNVWVGNDRRGFLWAGDNDQGWVPSNKTAAHSLKREGDTLFIQNHIIGTAPGEAPYKLTSSRSIQFQYNASPFKPLDKGFRINMRSAGNGFGGQAGYMYNKEKDIDGWRLLHPPTPDRSEWPEWFERWQEHNRKKNRSALYGPNRQRKWNDCQIPLRGYGAKSIEPGVYDYFGADWRPPGSTDELLTKTYTDYTIWLMDRMVEEGGIRQIYYDIAHGSTLMTNLAADHGYMLEDGRTQPEAGDDEIRRYAMRTYAMMRENGIYPTGVTGHATNAFCLKALPWFDAMLGSEFPLKDPVAVFPSDRMIAMSCPHSFGTGINHLKNMAPRWAALHDASMSGSSMFREETFDHPAMKHWGITYGDVEFIPYWRNGDYVRRTAEGLKTTIWKRPNSLILGVVNYGPDPEGFEKKRELAVTLNLEALDIPIGLEDQRLRVREFLPKDNALSDISLDGTTGALTGSKIGYHDIHFVVVHWEENPIQGEWTDTLAEAMHRPALDWGINRAESVSVSNGNGDASITVPDENLQAQAWKRKNSVLLRLDNPTSDRVKTTLQLDLAELGVRVDPETEKWRRFNQTFTVGGKGKTDYDGYEGTLGVNIPPGETKVLSVDKL